MSKLPMLLGLAFIAGCATSKSTFLPSGEKGYSITCSGAALSWGLCYEKAGELCGENGYEIIAGGSEQGAVIAGNQYDVYGGSTMNRNMLVQCKK